jgi:hypothetical protein
MGARLAEMFAQVGKEFGATGRMKLAMLTKMTSGLAQSEPDSPTNIKLFQEAIEKLRKQGKE